MAALKRVAAQLGNRPATCRKYYVHPAILEAHSNGGLFDVVRQGEMQSAGYGRLGLNPAEYSVMVLIADYRERQAKQARRVLRGGRKHRLAEAAPAAFRRPA